MQCLLYVSGAPDQRGSWHEAVSPWLCWPYVDLVEAVPGLVLLCRKMSCILQSFSPWLIPQTKRMRTRRLLWMTFWVLKVLSKPLATPCRPQTYICPMKHFSWVLDTAKKCVWYVGTDLACVVSLLVQCSLFLLGSERSSSRACNLYVFPDRRR